MQKYKNDVSDGWIFKQELRLFRNFLRNWDRDVDDSDFFTIFANSNNTDAEEEKTMLNCYFCDDELTRCDGVREIRRELCNGQQSVVVGFEVKGGVDDVIRELWNRGKSMRKRCRTMLEEWCGVMERRGTHDRRRKDPLESRFEEICRALKLGGWTI